MEAIEQHPDFSLTPHALELIDPEIRENQEITRLQIQQLAERTTQPVRDFTWQTSGKDTKISEMDPKFLLAVARHCVHRANFFHKKVSFFMEVLDIVEEHARSKGLEVPETVEEIQALLEQYEMEPVQQAPPVRRQDPEFLLDAPEPGFIAKLKSSLKITD